MNKLISIIIPVYNVEKYIEKCLLSCVNQGVPLNNYEIIIVNDGTKDSSLVIAEKIASDYQNIKIVSQPNQGLSVARNTGLKHAVGDYVWFVDSDDWIKEDSLKHIIPCLDGIADYVQLSFLYAYDDARNNKQGKTSQWKGYITGKELLKRDLLKVSSIPAQFAVYKKSLLTDNHLSFYPNVYYEDVDIKLRILNKAEKCICLDTPLYFYYQRTTGNIKSSFKEKHAMDAITVMNNLYSYSQDPTLSDDETRFMYYYFIGLCMNMIFAGIPNLDKILRIKTLRILKENRHLFSSMAKSHYTAYKWEGILGSVSVYLVYLFFRYLK